MQKYKIDVLNYRENGYVNSDCADITFYNTGNVNIVLNGALTLTPGQSIVFSANAGEIDRTIYRWTIGAGSGSLTIFRKIYY